MIKGKIESSTCASLEKALSPYQQGSFSFLLHQFGKKSVVFCFSQQVGFVCEVALINYNKATDSVVRLLYAKAQREQKTISKKC